MPQIVVSAPGKLMLSGEWSVLEKGNPCIVLAVEERVKAVIKESAKIQFTAKDIGIETIIGTFDKKQITWEKTLAFDEKNKIVLGEKAIEISLKYLQCKGIKTRNFSIETISSISSVKLSEGIGKKIGFGSSGAACVAIVGAILKHHGLNITDFSSKVLIYKLSSIAHYFGQGKVGSAFDIAASTFGGALIYSRFDSNWLVSQLDFGKSIAEIADSSWPGFSAKSIELPENFILCVGWTRQSASTKDLVLQLEKFKAEQSEEYWKIINSIKNVTENLIAAIRQSNERKILDLIKQNRKFLKELSDKSSNNLETKELALLSDIADNCGAAGKFSGAGGGDCGIAVCFGNEIAKKIKAEWKKNGIIPVEIAIAKNGVMGE